MASFAEGIWPCGVSRVVIPSAKRGTIRCRTSTRNSMEKRVLVAVFLSFLVLFLYQWLVVPPPKPVGQRSDRPGQTQPSTPERTETPQPGVQAPTIPQADPAAAPLVAAEEERNIVLDTDAVQAVFSNRGGVLTSWRLKRYLDAKGQPLDLVPTDLTGTHVHAFSLQVDDPALTQQIADATYQSTPDRFDASAIDDRATLTFEYRNAGGLSVRKEFEFRPRSDPYVIRFSTHVEQNGRVLNPKVQWGPAIGSGANTAGSQYYTPPRAIFYREGKVTRVTSAKLPQQPTAEGTLPFAGVEDHYFLSAEVTGRPGLKVAYEPMRIELPVEEGGPREFVSYSLQYQTPPPGVAFFFGPKDFDVLQAVNRDLVRAIDFGVFAWLVVPLLRALKWVNGFVGNYGWSIVILTILINAAMFPLRHKSVVSMRKLQEIQPEVKAIQERYAKLKATDPGKQKMNQEMMQLYRDRGVNPAGGCIPMLLTLPVLFAFYSLLSVAIELRGAPFVGWIHDLSTHDPLYITPILMGITMVVQQKMTPMAGDPMQQKMMMFMPIVFTGMFLWAPSGLVIYWFVSNLWAIGQQWLTNRLIGPPKVHTLRPAAERRVKKAGSGRSDQAEQQDATKEQA